mmetsp:Transcript_2812/g.6735  ORF Transcript_2812/g.6735 Transcript_2812/m.6735 type:complete len:1021 (+) Transcript_2812:91-3153(+)|eukprot:CAMPEP_0181431326 /NCGR_PEP_ID=MMETSP1110-20121109/18187_1 /TAXON_ID=174948 /ORGANISM="Symbiodinium sp., Strain CCMP421" /LENGTH=1020 /DNA_ID=CAMNT_0023554681 /DNA_START=82 /DNA_END=3144 /DNA_ORIENTATION=-
MWSCVWAWLMPLMCTAGPAVSLQNPEGQELVFLRLAVSAALFGPFAMVENEMVFQNPENRTMEGRFSFALPMGVDGPAMPSRFAMQIGEKLMEGEVVNRSKAQRVYREILHQARDPALLEQSQGNIFTARVFPIAPRALVRLVLSYTLTIPSRKTYRSLQIPMAGLPEIKNLTFVAVTQTLGDGGFSANCTLPEVGQVYGVMDGDLMRFAQEMGPVVPLTDAIVEVWDPNVASKSFAAGDGQLVTSYVVGDDVAAPTTARFEPSSWIVYVDTSASTADSFVVRTPLIEALLDAMPAVDVRVLAFDIEVEELWPLGPKTSAIGSSVRAALEARGPLGATDLELLLTHIQSNPGTVNETVGVLILSDFIATANERAAMKLAGLLETSEKRVVSLGVIGAKYDSAVGRAVAAAGGGRSVQIPLTSKEVPSVVSKAWQDLTEPLGLNASAVASSGWVWPETFFDLQLGDEVIVYSGGQTGLQAQAPELQIAGNTVSASAVQAPAASFGSLLSREATKARLDLLESERQLAQSADAASQIEFQIVELSETSRVMTPHTALLVLETDEDYVRFDIPQDRLSPILVVTASGVQLMSRSNMQLPALPAPIAAGDLPIVELPPNETGSNSSNDTACDVSDAAACTQPEDIFSADDAGAQLSGDEDDSYISSSAGGGTRSSLSLFLGLLVFLILQPMQAEWADPVKEADRILSKHTTPPKERNRDTASSYAGALWTKRRVQDLRNFCATWITWDPTNGLAFEYMSKAGQYQGDSSLALRAATSIAEVRPRDSEQLLRASWLALTLASESPKAAAYARRFAQRSLEERSDNVNTYRALAMAAFEEQDYRLAAETYARGLETSFHQRYGDVQRVLEEEAALFLRALYASDKTKPLFQEFSTGMLKTLDTQKGGSIGLRITLSWLTDANDVDLHVIDPDGNECYYANRNTPWGLELYSDQTAGLGPEVVVVSKKKGTYRVGVKYFSSGAMGASRGTVIIRQIDGGISQDPVMEVFTLPAGLSSVLEVATFTVK